MGAVGCIQPYSIGQPTLPKQAPAATLGTGRYSLILPTPWRHGPHASWRGCHQR